VRLSRWCGLLSFVAGTTLMFSGCVPASKPTVFEALSERVSQQYHQCVPLGWAVVPTAGSFYPGTNFSLYETNVIAQAFWLGRVSRRAASRRDGREVLEILDRLVRAGMVDKETSPAFSRFSLTYKAIPYFYNDDHYGSNRGAFPYLCFSTVTPTRILKQNAIKHERERTLDVRFAWVASASASWANDEYIQSHSVILSPTTSPATARLVEVDAVWRVREIHDANFNDPVVVDAHAW
jgi:hypothetical protein